MMLLSNNNKIYLFYYYNFLHAKVGYRSLIQHGYAHTALLSPAYCYNQKQNNN